MNELFKNISWSDYLLVVGATVMVYYTVVILLYFRKGLWSKVRSFRLGKVIEKPEENHSNKGELIDDLEATVKEIGHSILVPGNQATHDELLGRLQVRVANFGGLSRPGYRYALNNYIIEKAKENCGVSFSEEELERAWESLSR